jgi:hypothetical protein
MPVSASFIPSAPDITYAKFDVTHTSVILEKVYDKTGAVFARFKVCLWVRHPAIQLFDFNFVILGIIDWMYPDAL